VTDIFRQIYDLENSGVSVSIGPRRAYLNPDKENRYNIHLHWDNMDMLFKGGPCGAFGENFPFDDYLDFTRVFEEAVQKFKKRISQFLGGDGI
jgi:hypothetical protein